MKSGTNLVTDKIEAQFGRHKTKSGVVAYFVHENFDDKKDSKVIIKYFT